MTHTAQASWICVCLVFSLLPSTGNGREIQLAGNPTVSADGSQIAFSYAGDIWIASTDGGNATRLTSHASKEQTPLFSPDGTQLAFVSDRSGSNQVFVMNLDGSEPRQLTDHSEGFLLQDWSADGTHLLTLGNRDHHWRRPTRLISISAESRQKEQIVFDAYGQEGRWSPDGKKILFCREGTQWWRKGYVGSQASQIWLYDTETKEFTQLLNDPRGCRSPLWKPDASGFYYVGAESGSFNLREYNFESQETHPLTTFEDDSVVMPCLSRDGKTIVFRHLFDLYSWSPDQKGPPKKIALSTAGDNLIEDKLRRVLTTANNVSFTPDGLEMIFSAGGNLWAMDTVLKEPVPITFGSSECREPVLIQEGKSVLFLKEEQGQVDIYQATPANPELYWWQNTAFEIKRLTNDTETETNLQRSPDGEHFAVVKSQGNLWLNKLDGTPVRQLTSGFDAPHYDFSPDGKWIAYSQDDNDFNTEIWIAPIDGSQEPFNISRHPDNDFSPAWSPDGKCIAFIGQRDGDESDIYYVFLNAEDDEQSSRDVRLEEALEKLKKARPQPPNSEKADTTKEESPKPSEKTTGESEEKTQPGLVIDFEGLHDRLRRVSIPNADERGLFWLPDGKTLAFSASINGASGTYTIEIKNRLSPKRLTSSTGQIVQHLKTKDKVGWLSSGTPGTLSVKGTTESFKFSAKQELSVAERFQAGFNVAWRLMHDNWYDDNFGNRNWSEVRRKYDQVAGNVPDENALTVVIQLMLGELNGSHLGFYPRRSSEISSSTWKGSTPHLGLRFVDDFKGPGLKVRDVILNGPADRKESKIRPGEIVLAIDDTVVDPALDLTQVLNGPLDRDITLRVRNQKGEERQVQLRPISYPAARSLLYPQFEQTTAALVEKKSKGKLGYIHIQGMNMSSFREFERQLYNVGYGKDGLIIDVRENGGGFTADHLLTALTQPQHAATLPRGGTTRGYPQDRKVYATWNKPIVVLCNQNSFSNAEIFSHAIKTLKRGRLVGVTTAGGVISTGAASVMDLGTLRQPFRGWYLMDGEDMELNGAQPHVELWPQPGELPQGIDRQLEKAISLLKRDVKRASKVKQPKLKKATERETQPALKEK